MRQPPTRWCNLRRRDANTRARRSRELHKKRGRDGPVYSAREFADPRLNRCTQSKRARELKRMHRGRRRKEDCGSCCPRPKHEPRQPKFGAFLRSCSESAIIARRRLAQYDAHWLAWHAGNACEFLAILRNEFRDDPGAKRSQVHRTFRHEPPQRKLNFPSAPSPAPLDNDE